MPALDAGRPVVAAALHDEQRRRRAAVRLGPIDEPVCRCTPAPGAGSPSRTARAVVTCAPKWRPTMLHQPSSSSPSSSLYSAVIESPTTTMPRLNGPSGSGCSPPRAVCHAASSAMVMVTTTLVRRTDLDTVFPPEKQEQNTSEPTGCSANSEIVRMSFRE